MPAGTTTPIASALREILGPVGATLGSIAVILSVYGWLTGFTLMMPRVLYSMGQHDLPSILGRVHPAFARRRGDRRECHPRAGHGGSIARSRKRPRSRRSRD